MVRMLVFMGTIQIGNVLNGTRVHDDVIFYCGGRRKSVYLPILAVVKAEFPACTTNSTSGRVVASVQVKV